MTPDKRKKNVGITTVIEMLYEYDPDKGAVPAHDIVLHDHDMDIRPVAKMLGLTTRQLRKRLASAKDNVLTVQITGTIIE